MAGWANGHSPRRVCANHVSSSSGQHHCQGEKDFSRKVWPREQDVKKSRNRHQRRQRIQPYPEWPLQVRLRAAQYHYANLLQKKLQ